MKFATSKDRDYSLHDVANLTNNGPFIIVLNILLLTYFVMRVPAFPSKAATA